MIDASSSGRLVRVTLGSESGLVLNGPVLFLAGEEKIAAGRVIRMDSGGTVVAVLEKYREQNPQVEQEYELLYGEPFDEADTLPDYVADREVEEPNPANERFFKPDGKERGPELDDDDYTPEVSLHPKLPERRTFSPHNLTLGVGLFRNRKLPSADDPNVTSGYTTYQGYSFRYAYTFLTHIWLKSETSALLSLEGTFGIYNFEHRTTVGAPAAQVRVIPLGLNLRYMISVSKLFRLYPYVGYQSNIVSATSGASTNLEPLQGGRLLGGGGAQLVMSEAMDARIEGGSDGVLLGVVVKF